jgi:hypothetical protein
MKSSHLGSLKVRIPEGGTEDKTIKRLLILHLTTVLVAVRKGIFPKPAGLDTDIADLFSLPIPKIVWNEAKSFRHPETIRYVEGLLTKKST